MENSRTRLKVKDEFSMIARADVSTSFHLWLRPVYASVQALEGHPSIS